MGKIQNVPGSLLEKIGLTVGVQKLTLTKIRRAAEIIIQKNAQMKQKVKILNNHSQKVGQDIYDITNSRVRVEYVEYLNKIESKKNKVVKKRIDIEREERKKNMILADEKLREKNARNFLIQEEKKRKQNVRFTNRCNVKPDQKSFLQDIIFKELFNSRIQKFPKEKDWKKIFYRFLDSYEKDGKIKNKLRTVELEIFHHIKIDVEKKTGNWMGTKHQNNIADRKVASAIRSSFKSYEKMGVRRDGQFFLF